MSQRPITRPQTELQGVEGEVETEDTFVPLQIHVSKHVHKYPEEEGNERKPPRSTSSEDTEPGSRKSTRRARRIEKNIKNETSDFKCILARDLWISDLERKSNFQPRFSRSGPIRLPLLPRRHHNKTAWPSLEPTKDTTMAPQRKSHIKLYQASPNMFECTDADLNYLLEVILEPLESRKKNEEVSRVLSVPAHTTFAQLHVALQIAFQWNAQQSWEFKVRPCTQWDQKTQTSDYLLALVEQTYDMGPGSVERSADEVTLADVFEDRQYKGKIVEYIWDMHEMWSHIIKKRKKRKAATDSIICIAGQGKPPPRAPQLGVKPFTPADKRSVNRELDTLVLDDGTEPENWSDDGYRAEDEDDLIEDTDDDALAMRLDKARIREEDVSARESEEEIRREEWSSSSEMIPEQQDRDYAIQGATDCRKRAHEMDADASMSERERLVRRIRTS